MAGLVGIASVVARNLAAGMLAGGSPVVGNLVVGILGEGRSCEKYSVSGMLFVL